MATYGASNQGGDCGGTYDGNGPNSGCGDVYKLTPGGVETQLYDFSDSDTGGYTPIGPVVVDSAGYIYGTTTDGGSHGVGVLYKITSANHETVLRAFSSGTDGSSANGVTLAPKMATSTARVMAAGPTLMGRFGVMALRL